MSVAESKSWNVENRIESVTEAARQVFNWLDQRPVSQRAKYTSGLVVEEIAGNVIKYGFPDNLPHVIRFSLTLLPDHIQFDFEDDGRPFDPTKYPPPDIERLVHSEKAGGLGIELVRRVCSKVEYRRDGPFNRVTLLIVRIEPSDTQPIRVYP